MVGEGGGIAHSCVEKFSSAYKLFSLLTNFCSCLQNVHLLKNFQGRGCRSPPRLQVTNCYGVDTFVREGEIFSCFQILKFLINFHAGGGGG